MPVSSQSLYSNLSGSTGPWNTPLNYVTYDQPYLYVSNINGGNLDAIPSFLYFSDVHYRIDNQGNILAVSLNRDGSSPV